MTMVGLYPQEGHSMMPTSIPSAITSLENLKPVKSLVCSPDLSAFSPSSSDPLADVSKDGTKPFHCLLCDKSFEQKSSYQSHLKSHGREVSDPYRCNICGKTFAVPARLTRHYRTHTGEKPYHCEFCSKSFSVKENLSVHRRIHTKERPYKCDVCDRAFEHSGKLHRHMRIHTGERPHKCTVCSKTFIQSGQLVIHMRTHTGEKPYVCKTCGKGFTCSKQLKVHTRTHTGEKPYTCDICGKSFGYNHVLKLHQVAHYGEKVYKCTLCHETFTSKKSMEAHIKSHSDSDASPARDSTPMLEHHHHHHQVNNNTAAQLSNNSSQHRNGSNGSTTSSSNAYYSCQPQTSPRDLKMSESSKDSCDSSYYVYSREQYQLPAQVTVNPALLVAAAAAAAEDKVFQNVPLPPPIEPSHQMFLYSQPLSQVYNYTTMQDTNNAQSELLNLPGNDARRRVEAALEAVEVERQREFHEREHILTPPNSNPVSPASSPDPIDLVIPAKEHLSLPPRKRCWKILQSMESERCCDENSQRQSSVIRFARSS